MLDEHAAVPQCRDVPTLGLHVSDLVDDENAAEDLLGRDGRKPSGETGHGKRVVARIDDDGLRLDVLHGVSFRSDGCHYSRCNFCEKRKALVLDTRAALLKTTSRLRAGDACSLLRTSWSRRTRCTCRRTRSSSAACPRGRSRSSRAGTGRGELRS